MSHQGLRSRGITTGAHSPVGCVAGARGQGSAGEKLEPVLGPCAVVPGKLTAEKMNELLGFWAKSVDHTFPSLDFAKTIGLSKF